MYCASWSVGRRTVLPWLFLYFWYTVIYSRPVKWGRALEHHKTPLLTNNNRQTGLFLRKVRMFYVCFCSTLFPNSCNFIGTLRKKKGESTQCKIILCVSCSLPTGYEEQLIFFTQQLCVLASGSKLLPPKNPKVALQTQYDLLHCLISHAKTSTTDNYDWRWRQKLSGWDVDGHGKF